MSNYKGDKPFDREQLIFVVDAALIGALDRIESALPDVITWEDRNSNDDPLDLTWYECGGLDAAGMTIAVLYAQLTGDGLGIGDALACAGDFQEACRQLVKTAWKDKGKQFEKSPKVKIDTRKHAKAFVKRVFSDYLEAVR
jgi:hypothetical protein